MVSPELFAQYNKFLNRSFIDDNPNIKWCPAPGCTFSVRCDRKSRFTSAVISPLPSPPLNFSKIALSPSVVSSTQTRGRGLSLRLPFLFQLLRLEHWRPHARVLPRRGEVDAEGNWYVLSVPTFTLFFFFFCFFLDLSRVPAYLPLSDESENVNWLLANTKKCPNCHAAIEKNGGCMHMTCRKNAGGCGYEFCWLVHCYSIPLPIYSSSCTLPANVCVCVNVSYAEFASAEARGASTVRIPAASTRATSTRKALRRRTTRRPPTRRASSSTTCSTTTATSPTVTPWYPPSSSCVVSLDSRFSCAVQKIADEQRRAAEKRGMELQEKFDVRAADTKFLREATEQLLENRRVQPRCSSKAPPGAASRHMLSYVRRFG